MEIVDSVAQLDDYIATAVKVSGSSPVLIDQYLRDAIECDVDALCDGKQVFIAGREVPMTDRQVRLRDEYSK